MPADGQEVEYEAPITLLANTYTMHKVSHHRWTPDVLRLWRRRHEFGFSFLSQQYIH
jgi:hypothetical protein